MSYTVELEPRTLREGYGKEMLWCHKQGYKYATDLKYKLPLEEFRFPMTCPMNQTKFIFEDQEAAALFKLFFT